MGVTGFVARVLGAPLAVRDAAQIADAIVVVGAPLTSAGRLSSVGEERVRAGVELYRRGLAPILCLSGGGPGQIADGAAREADAMAARARELGVPAGALRVERDSVSTADNARRSAALLAADGCRRVWLVTQPFHTRRARLWFRRAGLDALAWYADDSVQFRRPRRALGWMAREYGAWVRMVAWDLRARFRAPR
jgi:uncharacterized SAM-binding protein YcdF (DUF218 family)